MEYLYQQGKPNHPIFLVLHGTGGNEQDLLPIVSTIDPDASCLSLRGDVNEEGMLRFFKRIRPGVFDEVDLIQRTKAMRTFIEEVAQKHGFSLDHLIGIGYSNGANMLASLLFHYNDVLKGAILYHPMVPIKGMTLPNLKEIRVFISAGVNDPICPKEESKLLEKMLLKANVDVELRWYQKGHQLSNEEVIDSKKWFESTIL